MKRIGILAGMGPRTTAPFLELVLDEAQKAGAKHDIDYPHIIIYSLPTPFYVDREIDQQAMQSALTVGVECLLRGGIDMLAIPCNSAHLYFEHITKVVNRFNSDISIPVLHIVDETIKRLPANIKKVALLATEVTIKSKLYHKKLDALSIAIEHCDALQAEVNRLISMLKTEGFSRNAYQLWHTIIKSLNCDCVIIACTDISICLNAADNPKRFVFLDSNAILAETTYSKYREIQKSSDERSHDR
jgi:aspartate racemase